MAKRTLSHKDVWKRIAEEKLSEFEEFRNQRRYLTAVYLAGYSVEAYLKRSICLRMDLDELPAIFKVHDLESLASILRTFEANSC
jgi:HEPN domain-containing protein